MKKLITLAVLSALAAPAAAQNLYDSTGNWERMHEQTDRMSKQRMHRERMQIEQEQLREMQEENEYRQREQLRNNQFNVPPVPRIPPLGGY